MVQTKDLLHRYNPPLKTPLTIYAKLLPSTKPGQLKPSLADRLSSRFGFKVKEFICWLVGITDPDTEFAYTETSEQTTSDQITIRSKVLVGGARFLPFLMGPTIKISQTEAAPYVETGGIIHDYGMITLLGGAESLIPTYAQSGRTLHFIVVSQPASELFWNGLRTAKLKNVQALTPTATAMLVTPTKPLPRAWHHLPNWLSVEPVILEQSYQIGKETAEQFVAQLVTD